MVNLSFFPYCALLCYSGNPIKAICWSLVAIVAKVNEYILHYRLVSSYYRGCGTYNRTFCVTLWTLLLYKVKFNTNLVRGW